MTIAPWATLADLPAQRPALPGGDEEWTRTLAAASQVLYHLSGGRWAGNRRRLVEVHAAAAVDPDLGPDVLDRAFMWVGVCAGAPHDCCACPSSLRLPGFPVTAVRSVTINGEVRDPATYRVAGRRYLETNGGTPWPLCDGVLVDYDAGRNVPDAGREAAVDYALALAEARIDPERSRLPGIASSITRQAVTITYRTALDFQNAGKVGITSVDNWLAAVNPTGRRHRPSSWSPDTDTRTYPQQTPSQ